MQKVTKSIAIANILFLFTLFFQLSPAGADGPYRGKVIDAETKEPIEGAVVLGVWRKRELFSFHPRYLFEEAKEVLTDKEGAFILPGHVMSPSIIDPMSRNRIRIYIYKPGYGSFPAFQVSPNPKQSYTKLLKPFETHALVELPKLKTREERLEVVDFACPTIGEDIPPSKVSNFIQAMNVDRMVFGFDPTQCFSEKVE